MKELVLGIIRTVGTDQSIGVVLCKDRWVIKEALGIEHSVIGVSRGPPESSLDCNIRQVWISEMVRSEVQKAEDQGIQVC